MAEQKKVIIASGASTASAVQFTRAYPLYAIDVGTMSTGSVVNVFASTDAGTTYHKVFSNPNIQTATVTHVAIQIGTSVGVGGGFVVIQGGYTDMQFRTAEVVSGGVSFNIIGLDG